MSGSLDGRIAIITGGAGEIGRASALEMARDGANIVIAQRPESVGKANKLAEEIENLGRKALVLPVDVTTAEGASQMAKKTLDTFGKIDILANIAGVTISSPFVELTEEIWQKTIDVNLKSVFLCCRAVVPHMIEKRYGRIITTSSGSGKVGSVGLVHYSASKGGVQSFTKALARELAPHKYITVNCVAPGPINTQMLQDAGPEVRDKIVSTVVLGRPGEVEEVAYVFAFLASDKATFITGQIYSVDGGRTMQ